MFGRGGGGGLDPSKMQQMMEQMGIDVDELDAEEVIIRTPDEELVFTDADVQRMDAQGQQTYNIVGSPESRERTDAALEGGDDTGSEDEGGIPQDDIDLVAQRTGVDETAAREALEATEGDLAAAVERLE
ncbi:MAG: nascent polypeptide-associated complex protein [Halovenus sp.]